MSMFWLGFVIGFLFLLGLLIALALFGGTKESDAQRVAREVREAKRQIDRIFADTRKKMEDTKGMAPPKLWKEDGR